MPFRSFSWTDCLSFRIMECIEILRWSFMIVYRYAMIFLLLLFVLSFHHLLLILSMSLMLLLRFSFLLRYVPLDYSRMLHSKASYLIQSFVSMTINHLYFERASMIVWHSLWVSFYRPAFALTLQLRRFISWVAYKNQHQLF